MALAVGQTSKGSTTGGTTATTTGVNTASSGSTFEVAVIFDGLSFTSIADNKGNTYTQVGTETAINGSNAKCRRYKKEGGVGGTGHTVTVTCASGIIVVLFMEVTGSTVVSDGTPSQAQDNASPFVSPNITTATATTLLTSVIFGDSGSNPATTSESTGFTVQVSELDGSSLWVCALATRAVTSTGTYASSFTQSGTTNSVVGILAWKETGSSGQSDTAGAGSYALTGQTVGLKAGRKDAAATGSYALTGRAVTLTGGRRLSAAAGSYALTGAEAFADHATTMAAGAYTLTGQAIAERAGRRDAADAGSYSLSGQAALLRAARRDAAATGTYSLTGQDVTLTYSGGGFAPSTVADAGSYVLTGQDTAPRAARRDTASAGAYSLTGQAVGLVVSRRTPLGEGAYALTGRDVSLFAPAKTTAEAGAYVLTGQSIGLTYGSQDQATLGGHKRKRRAQFIDEAEEFQEVAMILANLFTEGAFHG